MVELRSEVSDVTEENDETAAFRATNEAREREEEATRERFFRSVLGWRKPDSGRWRALRSR